MFGFYFLKTKHTITFIIHEIATAEQTRAWDAHTIDQEPISSIDLMERAVGVFVNWFVEKFPDTNRKAVIFCGPGNNGGDGLAAARRLSKKHYDVEVILLKISEDLSPDAAVNLKRLEAIRIVPIKTVEKDDPLPEIDEDTAVEELRSLLVRGGSAVIVRRSDGQRAILTKYDLIHALTRG